MKEENPITITENDFDHHMLTKLFPLAVTMLVVYIPYSFFYSGDYLAGVLQLASLIALIFLKVQYNELKGSNLFKDTFIFLGFPVLIPWLLSGGPVGHSLWWAPVYVLWVSFFSKGVRFFSWLLAYVFVNIVLVILSEYGIISIGYSIIELIHLLFAFSISAALIHYYESWRSYYKTRLEHELQIRIQTEEKYRQLLNTAPDSILVYNIDGEIMMLNKQAENIFGYQQNEVIRKNISQLIPDYLVSFNAENVKQHFTNNSTFQNKSGDQFFGLHKSNRRFPIELSLSLNKNEHIITAVIRDVTERHTMTQKLKKQNEQLNDFAHMASHDLRGPVANLKSTMIFLEEETNPDEQSILLKNSLSAINNLENTLNNMLEIVCEQNKSMELQNLHFDEVMEKILNIFNPEITQTQATISCNFDKVNNINYPFVYLESIIQNLLSNALRYKSPNRKPMIYFESDYQNDQIILTIRDNGLGIDLEKNGNRIFGLKQVFHKHPESKGIGLYLVKTHIENLGGYIYVDSQVDVGTTFTIVFNKNN